MVWLKALFVNLVAFLTVAPFVSFFLFWIIFYLAWKNKKRATGIAMDITTFFLIAVVSVMFNEIFNSGFGFWLIMLCFLIGAGLMGNAQNRLKGRLDYARIYRVVWRIGFLILSVLYVMFLLIGIIMNI